MHSSSKQRDGGRRISPAAESLEGRRLLSATPSVVANPAPPPGGSTAPWVASPLGMHGPGRQLVRHAFGFRGAPSGAFSHPDAQAATATAPPTATPTMTDAASTTATPTPSVTTFPWSGGMFGLMRGFGGMDGFSNLGASFNGPTSASASIAAPTPTYPSPPQGYAAPGGSTSVAPAPTAFDTAQAAAFQKLQADQATIHDRSNVTPALRAAFRNDLAALAGEVAATPTPAAVLALRSDILNAEGTLPTADGLAAIRADFTTVLTGAGVTDPAGIAKAFADLDALLTAANIGPADVATLTADLKAAGLPTTAPLMGMDLGVRLDALASVIDAAPQATAVATATATPAIFSSSAAPRAIPATSAKA